MRAALNSCLFCFRASPAAELATSTAAAGVRNEPGSPPKWSFGGAMEVASSSLVIRSKRKTAVKTAVFFCCEEWLKSAVRGTGKGMGSFALHII